jgi:hypothetical protein
MRYDGLESGQSFRRTRQRDPLLPRSRTRPVASPSPLDRRAPFFSLPSSNEERAGVRSRSSFRFMVRVAQACSSLREASIHAENHTDGGSPGAQRQRTINAPREDTTKYWRTPGTSSPLTLALSPLRGEGIVLRTCGSVRPISGLMKLDRGIHRRLRWQANPHRLSSPRRLIRVAKTSSNGWPSLPSR